MALLLPILSEHQRLLSDILCESNNLKFKLSDEELFSPLLPKRVRRQALHPYNRSLRKSVSQDKNFTVNIDVQQFSPDEITVKSVGNDTITVECKHEEKQDEHGSIYRHFVRRYKIPKGHDISKCNSKLSNDGVLTITVPKIEDKRGKTEINIPITFTNQPSEIQQPQAVESEKKA